MDSRTSSRRHAGVTVAIALVLASFAGTVVGLVGFGQEGQSYQDAAGFAILVAILLVGGGILIAQFAEDLVERLGPGGRRLALVGLTLACIAAWTWGLLGITSRGTQLRCALHQPVPLEQLARVLGDSPDAVAVFVPAYPRSPRPSAAELEGLRLRGGHDRWGEDVRIYEREGVTVSTTLASNPGPDELWGPTLVHIGEHGPASLVELWGPSEPKLRATWRGERMAARILPGRDGCGPANTLELRRTRAKVDILGPSVDKPLADFEGRLIGRTLAELGVVASGRYRGKPHRVAVALDGPRASEELLLVLDRDYRVEGWRLELGDRYQQLEELRTILDVRFYPTIEELGADGLPTILRRRHSAERPELRWSLHGTTLTLEAGHVR